MKKLLIPAAAALVLAVGPAWADDSESRTTVEQRTETDAPTLGAEHSRSVETRTTKHDDDDDDEGTTSVRRDERVTTGSGTMERSTEKRVEHDD